MMKHKERLLWLVALLMLMPIGAKALQILAVPLGGTGQSSYGTAGQFLQSQGSPSPAVWASPTGFVTAAQDQNRSNTYAVDTGAANAYVVTLSPAPAAYVDGMQVQFMAIHSCTGPSTLNVNGLGTKNIYNAGASSLVANSILIDRIYVATYSATSSAFLLTSPEGAYNGILLVANGGTGGASASAARTSLGAAASGTNSDLNILAGTGTGVHISTTLLLTNVNTQSTNYTVNTTANDAFIPVTTGSGTVTITFPAAAAGNKGQMVYVSKADAGIGTVAFSGTLATVTALATQGSMYVFISDGSTGWYQR